MARYSICSAASCCSVTLRAVPRMPTIWPFSSCWTRALMPIQRSLPSGAMQVGDVVLDFAVALQRGEEAAVGDVRGPRLEVEEAAAEQVLGRNAEDVHARRC